MSRDTIDFGIDLGTTNSVIAVAGDGNIEVIKNRTDDITPSAVYIDAKSISHVGKSALSNLSKVNSAAEVQVEFKREMGTRSMRRFKRAGKELSPTELSAAVLHELKRAAEERTGSAPAAAVITVPAMFEMPQRDATAQAARMAGFSHSILLQEPVAAATAFGYQADSDKAYWLVFDFGGGTFDASIISVRDGQLTVVKHAGDNFLGGADFDRCLVDDFIVPSLRSQHDLERLQRVNVASDELASARFGVLKMLAEEIKKDLSRSAETTLFREEVFPDDSGTPVDLDITVRRADFENAIRARVQKSIDITAELMRECRLGAGDIEKILLVGGSTFVPLVQQQVASLGIPVDRSMDPMTVVAYGAAVFASSQRMPKEHRAAVVVERGSAKVELEYDPIGKNLTPPVGGKVVVDGKPPETGTTVELVRSDGEWSSGRIALDAKGLFFADVHLREKGQSAFQIQVRNKSGVAIECSPSSFGITYGMSVGKATLPSGLQIGLADGTVSMLLAAGTPLPATSETRIYHTVESLSRGSNSSLRVPVLSGDEDLAELNLIGTVFHLHGNQVTRDLPKGTPVEVAARVDVSGTSTVSFTVPLLDETFEVTQASELEHESAEVLRDRLSSLRARLEELASLADDAGDDATALEIRRFLDSDKLKAVEKLLPLAASGDLVASMQARNELVSHAKAARAFAEKVEWPAKVAEIEDLKETVRRLAHEHGDAEERQMVQGVISEADRAIQAKDPRMLAQAEDHLRTAQLGIISRQPAFWAGFLQHLAGQRSRFSDLSRADQLFREGAAAMKRGDGDSLRSIVQELLRMLPPDVAARVQAGAGSSVI